MNTNSTSTGNSNIPNENENGGDNAVFRITLSISEITEILSLPLSNRELRNRLNLIKLKAENGITSSAYIKRTPQERRNSTIKGSLLQSTYKERVIEFKSFIRAGILDLESSQAVILEIASLFPQEYKEEDFSQV